MFKNCAEKLQFIATGNNTKRLTWSIKAPKAPKAPKYDFIPLSKDTLAVQFLESPDSTLTGPGVWGRRVAELGEGWAGIAYWGIGEDNLSSWGVTYYQHATVCGSDFDMMFSFSHLSSSTREALVDCVIEQYCELSGLLWECVERVGQSC